MSGLYLSRGLFPEEFLRPTVQFILDCQQPSGEIPWFEGGYTDPWDHVESAMGLAIGGETEAARKAYEWLVKNDEGHGFSKEENRIELYTAMASFFDKYIGGADSSGP